MENKFATAGHESSTAEHGSLLNKFVDDFVPLHPIAKTILAESIKSAPLFISGGTGLALTLVTHALAEAKTDSQAERQALDGTAGMAKGLLVRQGFESFGRLSPVLALLPTKYDLALRGAGLGVVSRFADTFGSVDTWYDKQAGKVDLVNGTLLTGAAVASPVAIGCDIASFGLTKGIHVGLNAATKGLVDKSAFLSMSVMGAAFGTNSGAIGEYVRQLKDNETLDLQKVATGALIGGASGGLAALPGGLQMHLKANSILKSMDYSEPTHTNILDGFSTRKSSINFSPAIEQLSNPNRRPVVKYADIAEPEDITSLECLRKHPESSHELFKRLQSEGNHYEDIPMWVPRNPESSLRTGTETGSIQIQPCLFTEYGVVGHKTRLLVPSAYIRELYSIREGQLKFQQLRTDGDRALATNLHKRVVEDLSHWQYFKSSDYLNGPNRALPEDVVRQLDRIPNSNLIKTVYQFGNRSPKDSLDPGATIRATANIETGRISLYALDRGRSFGRTMDHEWSHLLEDHYPNIFAAYKKAARLENALDESAKNPRGYGRRNMYENWAVLGETLLHPNAKIFIEWLNKAPLRSSTYSLALDKSLVENPAETCLVKTQLHNRMEFVQKELVPRVKLQLMGELHKEPINSRTIFDQLEVLRAISGQEYISILTDLTKNSSSESVASKATQLALESLAETPKRQVDFLFDTASATKSATTLSKSLSHLPYNTFIEEYFPRLQSLEKELGSSNKIFQESLNAFGNRCWNETTNERQLPIELSLYWLSKCERKTLHRDALENLERLAKQAEANNDSTKVFYLLEHLLPIKQKMSRFGWEVNPMAINLANLYMKHGRFADAERIALKQIMQPYNEYGASRTELNTMTLQLADCQYAQNKLVGALVTYQNALKHLKHHYLDNIEHIQVVKQRILELKRLLNL